MEKQVLKMPLSYFLKAGDDGNISLSSIIKRVDDASKVFENNVIIELDNGVKCSSREELLDAVSQAKIDTCNAPIQQNTPPQYSSAPVSKNEMSTGGKVLTAFVIAIFALILWFIIQLYTSG